MLPRLDRSPHRNRPAPIDLLAFLALFAVTVLLQYAHNAYGAEIGSRADEAEHFVTGVFFQQYLLSGAWLHPYTFATQYYFHYPKVSIGNWPPFFYFVQAIWMLVFSVSRTSIMALMAAVCGLVAFIIYRLARPVTGAAVALGIGLMYLFNRVVHQTTAYVMADGFTALMSLVASLAFWLYLESPSVWRGLVWGVVTAMAMMSKGNAVALALIFPAAILLTRRWRLLKRIDFWLSVLLVAAVCLPWYTTTFNIASRGWAMSPQSIPATAPAYRYFRGLVWTIHLALGILPIGMLPFVVIGYAVKVARPVLRGTVLNLWAVLGAFLPGWVVFHIIVPAGTNPRMLMASQAVALVFAGVGIHWLCQRSLWGPAPLWLRRGLLLAACGALVWLNQSDFLRKPDVGFTAAAQEIVADPELDGAGILISSTGDGERMLIAEMALAQPKPKHVIVRASKLLTSTSWSGQSDHPLYQTVDEVAAVLDRVPISMLVIDDFGKRYTFHHHALLHELVKQRSDDWECVDTFGPPDGTGPGPIAFYRRRHVAPRPVGTMSIDLPGFGSVRGSVGGPD